MHQEGSDEVKACQGGAGDAPGDGADSRATAGAVSGHQGLALWTRLPVVAAKLAQMFAAASRPGVYVCRGEGWQQQVQTLLGQLSATEQLGVLATTVGADGEYDAWQAAPVQTILRRVETPWLPVLLDLANPAAPGGMVAHFQPIVDLHRHQVVAFEALMRGQVDGHLYNAGQIIDAARAHDALFQFDQQARTTAIRQGVPLLLAGESLFINFNPSVIYDPKVCLRATWRAAQELGCPMSRLVFEVVECERFPDIDRLRSILDAYRDMGAHVALDDLGAGHTALTYIDALQPDLIKLDRGLLPRDPRPANLSLLRGIVDHAHGRGIRVLVEGIETQAQAEAVTAIACDLGQGWYYGKPAPSMLRQTLPVTAAA
ncbi:MAG: EAL domain-containing protein [Phycisphaeraceae bacterium]